MTKNELIGLISKFIAQAYAGDLKTREYQGNYRDLTIHTSFGQGVAARIPLMAFTGYEQEVQKILSFTALQVSVKRTHIKNLSRSSRMVIVLMN